MHVTALVVFAGALLVAAASPGPGIFALIARVISGGPTGAAPFALGLILGDLVWLAAAVLGLAVLAHTLHDLFFLIKFVGAAYLLYLAHRMWTAPAEVSNSIAVSKEPSSIGLFFAGLSVTLGNPKVVAFYVALLPSLIDLTHVGLAGYAELSVLCVSVLSFVFGAYIFAAGRARAFFRSRRAVRLFNRTGSVLIAGAAVAVATQ